MDIKIIRALSKILTESELTSLEVQEGELRIKLTKQAPPIVAMQAPAAQEKQMLASNLPAEKQLAQPIDPGLNFNDARTIDSPMVGVFYQSATPGDAPYVQVGSKVKAGQVVCIIEAMKLFNEITAKKDGEVVDICVADGDVVEYGQPLFKIV